MTEAVASGAAAELLRDVLPGVSRSFALSLRILPGPLRAQRRRAARNLRQGFQ